MRKFKVGDQVKVKHFKDSNHYKIIEVSDNRCYIQDINNPSVAGLVSDNEIELVKPNRVYKSGGNL